MFLPNPDGQTDRHTDGRTDIRTDSIYKTASLLKTTNKMWKFLFKEDKELK